MVSRCPLSAYKNYKAKPLNLQKLIYYLQRYSIPSTIFYFFKILFNFNQKNKMVIYIPRCYSEIFPWQLASTTNQAQNPSCFLFLIKERSFKLLLCFIKYWFVMLRVLGLGCSSCMNVWDFCFVYQL